MALDGPLELGKAGWWCGNVSVGILESELQGESLPRRQQHREPIVLSDQDVVAVLSIGGRIDDVPAASCGDD